MSNIQDIRAQLRAEQNSKAGSRSVLLPALAAVVVCLAASGLVYFLFLKPVVVPLRPSASLPTFRQVGPDGQIQQSPFAPQPGEIRVQSTPPEKYAGLSPRQTGKVADEVCFARAHAKFPNWSKTPRLTTKTVYEFSLTDMPHFNELMHCLLTEAPVRYCSSSQRGIIAAEISMYFRVLEDGNRVFDNLRKNVSSGLKSGRINRDGMDQDEINRINRLEFAADQRVTAAIEARLADGSLTKADREAFSAMAPQPIRQRFANVKPSTPLCPAQPWWAFWRSF
jgi:hypothetical protein